MSQRPRLSVPLTDTDTYTELVAWMCLIVMWSITLGHYKTLPDTIPTHFALSGEADGFGAKSTLIMLCGVGTVLFVAMSAFHYVPHWFNYPRPITPDNALAQYTTATRLLRYIKLAVAVIFLSVCLYTIYHVTNEPSPRLTEIFYSAWGVAA